MCFGTLLVTDTVQKKLLNKVYILVFFRILSKFKKYHVEVSTVTVGQFNAFLLNRPLFFSYITGPKFMYPTCYILSKDQIIYRISQKWVHPSHLCKLKKKNSLRGVLTFVASGLDINGCVLSYFEGTAILHCYTSCTLTTLHCSKVSFLQCCLVKIYNKIFTKMWGVYSLLWDNI